MIISENQGMFWEIYEIIEQLGESMNIHENIWRSQQINALHEYSLKYMNMYEDQWILWKRNEIFEYLGKSRISQERQCIFWKHQFTFGKQSFIILENQRTFRNLVEFGRS